MRDRANVFTSIWGDDEFRRLHAESKMLYFALLTHPLLSYCGVLDWRPKRLAKLIDPDWDAGGVVAAGAELQAARFILVDDDTEEVVVRAFVRRDGVLKQRNLAASVVLAWSAVVSRDIRSAIAVEVQRAHVEQPDWAGWSNPKIDQILRFDSGNSEGETGPVATPKNGRVDPHVEGGSDPTVEGLSEGQTADSDPRADPRADPHATLTSTSTTTLQIPDNDAKGVPGVPPRLDVERLCTRLADRIEGNGSKRPSINKGWRDACRLMIDTDGRDPSEVERVIDWCQRDEFWRTNILSMRKLRAQFDRLRLKSGAAVRPAPGSDASIDEWMHA